LEIVFNNKPKNAMHTYTTSVLPSGEPVLHVAPDGKPPVSFGCCKGTVIAPHAFGVTVTCNEMFVQLDSSGGVLAAGLPAAAEHPVLAKSNHQLYYSRDSDIICNDTVVNEGFPAARWQLVSGFHRTVVVLLNRDTGRVQCIEVDIEGRRNPPSLEPLPAAVDFQVVDLGRAPCVVLLQASGRVSTVNVQVDDPRPPLTICHIAVSVPGITAEVTVLGERRREHVRLQTAAGKNVCWLKCSSDDLSTVFKLPDKQPRKASVTSLSPLELVNTMRKEGLIRYSSIAAWSADDQHVPESNFKLLNDRAKLEYQYRVFCMMFLRNHHQNNPNTQLCSFIAAVVIRAEKTKKDTAARGAAALRLVTEERIDVTQRTKALKQLAAAGKARANTAERTVGQLTKEVAELKGQVAALAQDVSERKHRALAERGSLDACRAENATLRRRVAALETAAAVKKKPAKQRQPAAPAKPAKAAAPTKTAAPAAPIPVRPVVGADGITYYPANYPANYPAASP